jgi:hypothetical protein
MWSTGPYMGQTGTLLLVRVPSSPTPGPMGGGMLRLGHALFRLHEPLPGRGSSVALFSPHESTFQGEGAPLRVGSSRLAPRVKFSRSGTSVAFFSCHEPFREGNPLFAPFLRDVARPTSQIGTDRERLARPTRPNRQAARAWWPFDRPAGHFAPESGLAPRSFATWPVPRPKRQARLGEGRERAHMRQPHVRA